MAILETEVSVDVCINLWKELYMAEGDELLILIDEEILSPLENQLDNDFVTKNIECVVDEALLMILYAKNTFIDQ